MDYVCVRDPWRVCYRGRSLMRERLIMDIVALRTTLCCHSVKLETGLCDSSRIFDYLHKNILFAEKMITKKWLFLFWKQELFSIKDTFLMIVLKYFHRN